MQLTNEYLRNELIKINELLVSESLHEVDEATHITAKLIKELEELSKG